MSKKFSLGSFEAIAKIDTSNKGIKSNAKKQDINVTNNQNLNNQKTSFAVKVKDPKIIKSLSLRKSTVQKLDLLAKEHGVSSSQIADQAIRNVLNLED